MSIDYRPPSLTLAPGITYAKRAGSVALVYDVSDDTERDGVEVGDRFYPSIAVERRRRPAGPPLRAVPARAGAAERREDPRRRDRPRRQSHRAHAADQHQGPRLPRTRRSCSRSASSTRRSPIWPARRASNDSDSVEDVPGDQHADPQGERGEDPRASSPRSAPEPLFTEAFEQMPDSQVRSSFAERRSYFAGRARRSPSRSTTATTSRRSPARRSPRRTRGTRGLRRRTRHLRQLRDPRSRSRAAHALRTPLQHRREGRRHGREGPDARTVRDRPASRAAITCTSRSCCAVSTSIRSNGGIRKWVREHVGLLAAARK